MRMAALALAAFVAMPATAAELRGHGGPVRALAVSPDGENLVSGSFDSTLIVWSLTRAAADAVLQFHSGSVNAVVLLPDGRLASGGQEGKIVIWRMGTATPDLILEGHTGPIAALAANTTHLASASWDGTARVWPLAGGDPRVLTGHRGNVNGVAFIPGGVATAGYDATLRLWPDSGEPRVLALPSPLNTLAAFSDGRLVTGGADGRLRLIGTDGTIHGDVEIGPTPVIATALSPDGTRIAGAGVRGAIAVVNASTLETERLLVGPGLPVWSLAFTPDSRHLLTGGNDRIIRRWNAETGEMSGSVAAAEPDPLAAYTGDRGAQVFRACIACHTLRPEEGLRAGPSLHGVMGRKIGTLPGYSYSSGFAALDIVWTKETVAKLFEIGPHAFTPGTKMPEQIIVGAEDRKALVDFLAAATKD